MGTMGKAGNLGGAGNGERAGRTDTKLRAQPRLGQREPETQPYGTLTRYPLGLSDEARAASVEILNQVLADTITLRDLYKKHHWQTSGPTFYQLHLLFDKHYEEQSELVDALAERVQILGGVALAMAHDIAETAKIERPPRGRESVPVQLSRLLEAHEHILTTAREGANRAGEQGDSGTDDLLVSEVVRTNEMQVWFLSEHLVDQPLARTEQEASAQPNQGQPAVAEGTSSPAIPPTRS